MRIHWSKRKFWGAAAILAALALLPLLPLRLLCAVLFFVAAGCCVGRCVRCLESAVVVCHGALFGFLCNFKVRPH